MREIKFRGMKENGEWVVGYYLVHIPTDEHKIHYLSKILGMSTAIVDKKTVGQYTGLKDKNGVEIYAGDVVKWLGYEVKKGRQIRPSRFFTVTDEIDKLFRLSNLIENGTHFVEIIGNIYENPELVG